MNRESRLAEECDGLDESYLEPLAIEENLSSCTEQVRGEPSTEKSRYMQYFEVSEAIEKVTGVRLTSSDFKLILEFIKRKYSHSQDILGPEESLLGLTLVEILHGTSSIQYKGERTNFLWLQNAVRHVAWDILKPHIIKDKEQMLISAKLNSSHAGGKKPKNIWKRKMQDVGNLSEEQIADQKIESDSLKNELACSVESKDWFEKFLKSLEHSHPLSYPVALMWCNEKDHAEISQALGIDRVDNEIAKLTRLARKFARSNFCLRNHISNRK